MLFLFFSSMNCWLRLRRKLWWFYLESYLVAPARSLISLPLCLPCIRRSLLINRRVSATHKSREEYTRTIFKGVISKSTLLSYFFIKFLFAARLFFHFLLFFLFFWESLRIRSSTRVHGCPRQQRQRLDGGRHGKAPAASRPPQPRVGGEEDRPEAGGCRGGACKGRSAKFQQRVARFRLYRHRSSQV